LTYDLGPGNGFFIAARAEKSVTGNMKVEIRRGFAGPACLRRERQNASGSGRDAANGRSRCRDNRLSGSAFSGSNRKDNLSRFQFIMATG
jgi:hypothetical protein